MYELWILKNKKYTGLLQTESFKKVEFLGKLHRKPFLIIEYHNNEIFKVSSYTFIEYNCKLLYEVKDITENFYSIEQYNKKGVLS